MEESMDSRSSKLLHRIRENHEKKIKERKRNILYLIHGYLKEHNLNMAAEVLADTANLSPAIEVCDNVDLDTIFQEYISYYHIQFNKYPKITKQVTPPAEGQDRKKPGRPQTRPKSKLVRPKTEPSPNNTADEFDISVKSLTQSSSAASTHIFAYEDPSAIPPFLCGNLEGYPPDWKEIFELVSKQIIPKTLGVKWTDCIGMESVIDLLQEAIVYPVMFPEVFQHIDPWKGILLYGPPGTGKTLVAKALACETNSVFINVCASTFVSKWRGESEKLVKVLFEVAQFYKPCTIFIDELEAIASSRDERQHEASRRFKSELLTQMDGLLNHNEQIFILATSNLPWAIDPAVLRRLDKKLLVDLPDGAARMKIFQKYLQCNALGFGPDELRRFADLTKEFSASDIALICKEVSMKTARKRIVTLTEGGTVRKECNKEWQASVTDVEDAILNARPASCYYREKYRKWQSEFGGI